MATTISRPTITDDNGTGTTGTVYDAAWMSDFQDRIDAMFNGASVFNLGGALALGRYTTTATGTQNDWAIDTANSGTTVGILRCNNASALTINGIVAPSSHRVLVVEAINSTVSLAHENASSTAANRITTPTAATVAIPSGGYAFLLYDVTTARWRVLSPHATRIDDLSSAADNTNLNVSTSAHGLVPKVSGSDGYTLQKSGTGAVWASAAGGAPATSTITTTGTQTALSIPTGSADLVIFCNNATLLTVQGITAGVDGQRLSLISIGAGQVDIANQNGSASAANRIINLHANTVSLAPGYGRMGLVYDATAARWRVMHHDQGDYIDYYGTSTIVGWSSLTANRRMIWYKVVGRTLAIVFHLEGTSNATSCTFTLPFTVQSGGSAGYPNYSGQCGFIYDNSAYPNNSAKITMPATNQIEVTLGMANSSAGWTASGTKIVDGVFTAFLN